MTRHWFHLVVDTLHDIGVCGLDPAKKKLGHGFGQGIGILGKGDKDGGDPRLDNCIGSENDLHSQEKG